jgi:hypothetical protein
MLKARDVWEEQEARKEQRMSAMRPVLSQLFAKIRQQAVHDPKAPYLVYEIPTYVWGYALFDMNEAREYLIKTLEASGFLVWVVDQKYLFISWMKVPGGQKPNYRPPLVSNYRPQVYDPSTLGSALR